MGSADGLDGTDEAPLDERRPAGMPPGTFRAIVTIVVVLLLINVYALYLIVDIPDGEVDDGDGNGDNEEGTVHPWNRKIEPLEISDEVVWEGLEGRLETPVRVMDGGHLTLEDCDIQLHHDDMLWFNGTYFDVEPGGALDIVDSTINVVSNGIDPNTLVGPYYSDYDIPVIHRVVNLAGTSDPLLSFDLRWRFNGTPLTVGLQPTPESAIMTLEELDPQGTCTGWEHHEYDLGFYVGTTPRIVIFFSEYPDDVIMIRNINVIDGGDALPFDLPHNVSTSVSGWTTENFLNFDSALRYQSMYQTVVNSEGAVHISGSTLKVPIELRRWGRYEYNKEGDYFRWRERNWWASVAGMEIGTYGGDLTIEGSYLENVPVEANDSQVSVVDTRFSSGYDMLTLNASHGVVDGCSFEFTGIGQGLQYWDEDDGRSLWAISVEKNEGMEPFEIVDCTFLNVQQALDLSHATVSVTGCVFQGATELAIWNHMSDISGGWERLASGNTFSSCTGHLYLETVFSEITFDGVVDYWSYHEVLDTEGVAITEFGMKRDFWRVRNHDEEKDYLYRPMMLAETEQMVRYVDYINVTVSAETTYPWYLYGRVNFSIPSIEETIHVDLFPLLEDQVGYPSDNSRAPITIDAIAPYPEYAEGAFIVIFDIYVRYLYALNVTFDIYKDDSILYEYNETEVLGLRSGSPRVYLQPIINFKPGPQELTLVISGNEIIDDYNISQTRTEIENVSYRFMRATHNNTSEEVRDFLTGTEVYLLLDEAVSFDLDGLEPSNKTSNIHYFIISTLNNTSLTFRNMDYPVNTSLFIMYEQPLNISIVDCNLSSLDISAGENAGYFPLDSDQDDPYRITCSLTIENSSLGGCDLYTSRCDVRIADTTINKTLWLTSRINGTVVMTNINVVDLYYCFIYGSIWSLSVNDCSFKGRYTTGLRIEADSAVSVTIDDTTFVDCFLSISLKEWKNYDWELGVTDCEFKGLGSFLSVLWNLQENKWWEYYPSTFNIPQGTIEGNSFSGERSGLVLHHDLFDGLLGDNEVTDGASVWAWYMPSYETEPMEEGYPSKTHDIILGTETYTDEFPFIDYWTNKGEHYYLDVTDDPSIAIDPAPFLVVMRWEPPSSYYFVAGFGELYLTEDSNVIRFPIWPDLQGVLSSYIKDWPWDMENYPGARW